MRDVGIHAKARVGFTSRIFANQWCLGSSERTQDWKVQFLFGM